MRMLAKTMILAVSLGLTQSVMAEDLAVLKKEGRLLAKQFFGALKPELINAMKSGGPVQALAVCQIKAPEIAESVSLQSGWAVKRVSLKPRNPDNVPDAFEREVLERFETKKAQGESVKQLEYGAKVTENGHTVFRYMKAIPTGKVCLVCHGQTLAAPVRQKIQQLYPEDRATGFQLGDIRGAFSFKKVLDE